MARHQEPIKLLRDHLIKNFGPQAILSSSWTSTTRNSGRGRAPKPVLVWNTAPQGPLSKHKFWTFSAVVDHWLEQWQKGVPLTGVQGPVQLTGNGQKMLAARKKVPTKTARKAKTPTQQLAYLAKRVYEFTGLTISKEEWRTGYDGNTNTWYRHDALGKFYCISSKTPGKGVVAVLKELAEHARDPVTGKYRQKVTGCKDGAQAGSSAQGMATDREEGGNEPAAKRRRVEATSQAQSVVTSAQAAVPANPAAPCITATGRPAKQPVQQQAKQAQQQQTRKQAPAGAATQPPQSHAPTSTPSAAPSPAATEAAATGAAAAAADDAMGLPSSSSGDQQLEKRLARTKRKLDKSRKQVDKLAAKLEAACKRAEAAAEEAAADQLKVVELTQLLASANSKLATAEEQLQAAGAQSGQATATEAALAAAREEGRKAAVDEAKAAAKEEAKRAAKKARKTERAKQRASSQAALAADEEGDGEATDPAAQPQTAEEWQALMGVLKTCKRKAEQRVVQLEDQIKHAATQWSRC